MVEWIFLTCYALVIGHELDAIQQKEWRIFPGTNLLPDQLGFRVFTALHVPLFMLLNWLFFSQHPGCHARGKVLVCHFCYRAHRRPLVFFATTKNIGLTIPCPNF